MSNTLLIKRSSAPNAAPSVGNLALGELAINTYDGRLYTKVDTGTPSVFELTQNQPITVTGNVLGTSVNGVGNTTIDLTLTTTGVTAATYGGTTGATSNIGVFTVDQYGRITSASNVAISTSSLANGTSNIQIINNGNITVNPSGTPNVAVFANTGVYVTGVESVSGNITGGNILTGGLISATGNVTGGNVLSTGYISSTGYIQGLNIYATGNLDATGGITTLGNISSAGNVLAVSTQLSGVLTATGNITGGNLNTGGIVSATGNLVTGANLVVTGYANITGNASGGNLTTSGQVSATGNITGGNVRTTNLSLSGNVLSPINSTSNITTTGNAAVGSILTDNYYYANGAPVDFQQPAGSNTQLQFNNNNDFGASANLTFDSSTDILFVNGTSSTTGNVIGGNINTAGLISATGNITGGNVSTGIVTATGNITGGNLRTSGLVTVTGNITGGNILTVGNAEVGGIKTDNYYYANGAPVDFQQPAGSNTQIQFNSNNDFGASANFTFDTTANVLTVNATANIGNTNITGYVSASANVTGANVLTGGLVSATGNVTGGNLITTGLATITGNVTGGNLSTSGLMTASGNVTGGNLLTSGLISASGALTAGQVSTAGNVSAAGNVTGGNINTAGLVQTPTVTNASGGITITTGSNGNINLQPNGTGNIVLAQTYINRLRDPVQDQDAATKNYVDNMVAAGIDIHTPAINDADNNLSATYADGGTTPTWTTITNGNTVSTGSVHNLSVNDIIVFGTTTNGITAGTPYFVCTIPSTTSITLSDNYNGEEITTLTNGTGLSITSLANAGVGATLTSTTNGPYTDEGYTAALNDRILVLGQTDQTENGIYYISQVGVAGGGGSPWVMTRATDGNKYGQSSAFVLDQGAYFFINGGNDAGEAYVCNTTGAIVFGTTDITFAEFSRITPYTAGNGLSLTSGAFSVNVDNNTTAIVAGNVVVKASANLTTPNIGAATGTSLSVTGNVTGGNLNTGGIANITGNVVAGNITTAGLVTATGNVIGGNINTGGIVSVLGNIIGGNVSTTGTANVSTLIVTSLANIISTTVSTSATTGAMTIAGGLGVVGNVYGGGLYSGGEAVLTINSTIDGGSY